MHLNANTNNAGSEFLVFHVVKFKTLKLGDIKTQRKGYSKNIYIFLRVLRVSSVYSVRKYPRVLRVSSVYSVRKYPRELHAKISPCTPCETT